MSDTDGVKIWDAEAPEVEYVIRKADVGDEWEQRVREIVREEMDKMTQERVGRRRFRAEGR